MEEQRGLIQEALRAGEERLQALLDDSMVAVYLKDLQGRYLMVNRWSEVMFRVTREEAVGKTDHELFPKEVADALRANDSKALEAEAPSRFEQFFLQEDGEYIYEATKFPLYDSAGNLYAVCGIATDVTERKRTEEALKESEERYRRLVENSPETIVVLSEGRIVFINAAGARLAGADGPEELVGKPYLDFVHPDFRRIVRSRVSQAQEGKPTELLRQKLLRLDGGILEVETVAISTTYEGKPAVQSIIRDITERKRAEEALKESEERFRGAFEDAPIGVALVGLDGHRFRVNYALCEMLGYSEEELLGKDYLENIHPDDREMSQDLLGQTLEKGTGSYTLERRYIHAGGHTVWNLSSVSLIRDSQGNPTHFVCLHQDITERKRAEEELKESEERYRAVVEQSVESIFLFDADTKHVLESNTALRKLLGYTPEELRETTIYDLVAHERDDVDSDIQRDLQEKRRFAGERQYRRKDGSLVDVEVSMTVIPYHSKEVLCHLARDVSERKALEEQLRHRAFHDSLTELPNRALFLDRLQHALDRSGRLREPVAVLFVDLDDFKIVNDSLGHDAGNLLLVEVGERLRACVRTGDTVARLFGDEFAVLLEAPTYVEEARRVTGRIGERLQAPFDLDGKEVFVTPSVGIALSKAAEDRPRDLLQRADLAMYAAKRRGKARYEIFEEAMDTRATKRLQLENELRWAIERQEFEVYYQPIFELGAGRIYGVEALARWRHPERGLLAPSEFILLAEESGLIRPIGQWVLEEACRQAREWRAQHPENPPLMSVNFPTGWFGRRPDLIPEVLADTGLQPGGLQLEITERAMMDDPEFSLDKLRGLKSLGLRFAIDDYGMGYSRLHYLKHVPLALLKIDRSFIAGLEEDPKDTAIVSTTIDLAHALGLKVVAEGVETADQLAKLKELGCDMVQGFYLTEPLAGEVMTAFLAGYYHRE